MKDIKDMNRLVIIYTPYGKEEKYSTTDVGDETFKVVKTIECEPGLVKIGLIEDGEIIGRVYCMPYFFEMF